MYEHIKISDSCPKDMLNYNFYYVFLNGEYTYFVVPTRELFNDSGTDTYNYGAWTAYELARQAIDNQVAGIYDIPSEE